MNRKTKILLVENAPVISGGFQAMIHTLPNFEVVDVEESLDLIFERITVFEPDILVINPSVIDFSKRMMLKVLFQEFPQLIIVAITHQLHEPRVIKQYDEVIDIHDDAKKIEQKLNRCYAQHDSKSDKNSNNYELTDRETEILISVAKGMMNKEIADSHHISVHTVITHRKNIIKKTGIKSVAGLTVYALLHNLIDEGDV
ncbi:MAG: response regulator transcription factor [Bacteroidales bacterium]|jgi:DNA-binding NarL/FixJ family response regulator|nr:response regulator transcription factor [Bacteroidales bacterium]